MHKKLTKYTAMADSSFSNSPGKINNEKSLNTIPNRISQNSIRVRGLLTFLILFLSATSLFAQPQLIPVNVGANQYPITFTDPSQQILTIKFDEIITNLGNATGWTVTIGGAPVVIFGPIFDPSDHSIIQFNMSVAVTYANRNSVIVSYDPAASTAGTKLQGASGLVAAFGPITAVNNLVVNCESWDLSKFDYSQILTEVCAPIDVSFSVTYYLLSYYVNSINYNPATVRIYTFWGDLTIEGAIPTVSSPGVFTHIFSHTYPDNPAVCFWEASIFPRIGGSNCTGGGLRKYFTYQNHSLDDEGDATFNMQIDTIQVCLGQDFTEIFTDATYFNCNPQTEPDYANDGERYIRFTYGTNFAAGPRIQDILINGFPQAFPFQSPVVKYDSIQANGIPSPSGWASTDPISHTANLGTDAVGQIFEITLENWNPCNPYNIFETNPPIITRSYIKIVDAPIAVPGPDFTICYGNTATMAGSITNTATTGFWDTNTGDGTWTNATSPTGAIYTPGPNDLVNNGVWLVLHASDPLSSCPDHVDSMYVTIRDELVVTGPVTGPDDICQSETGLSYSVPNPAPVMPVGGATEYVWSVPAGWSITAGQNTQSITVNAGATTGNQNVSVILRFTTSPTCASNPEIKTTTVNKYPVGTNQTFTRCENNSLNINPQTYTDVPSCTFAWSGDNGSSGTGIINDAPTNPGTTQIDVIYTIIPTGPTGCVGNPFTITVHVDPETNTGTLAYDPGEDEICLGESVHLTLSGYVGAIDRYRWYRDGAFNGQQNSTSPTFTHTPNNSGTWEYQVRVQSGSCLQLWSPLLPVIVDPPTVPGSVTPNRTRCEGSTSGLLTLSGNIGNIDDWEFRYRPVAGAWGGWTAIGHTGQTYTSGALSAGTYEFRAIVTSGECLTLTSTAATINVDPASVGGTLTGGNDICNGGDPTVLTLTGGSYTGTIIRWEVNIEGGGWNTVPGPTGASYNPPATTVAGDHVYRVSVQSGTCSEDFSTQQTITVNNPLTVSASGSENSGVNDDMIICFGESVDLSATITAPGSGTGFSYNWLGDNAQSAAGANPTIVPNSTGTIRYTVTLTDDFVPTAGGSCEATDFVDVIVLSLPTVGITPAGPTALCMNADQNLNGNAVAGTRPISTYAWTGDTGPLDVTNVDDVVFNSPSGGTFNLTYTVTDNYGCNAVDATTLVVTGPEVNIVAPTAGVCEDNSIVLTATEDLTNSAGGETRAWTGFYGVVPLTGPQLTALLSTTNNPITSFNTIGDGSLSTGTYTMIYTVTDANSCFDADTIIVDVSTVSAALASDPTVCAGTGLIIDGQPSGGTGIYPVNTWTKVTGGVWTLVPNGDPTTATMTVPTVVGSAVYTLNYYVEDQNGCSFTTPNYNVTVYEVPVANAGNEDWICTDLAAAVDYTLGATPSVGTGTWTVVSKPTVGAIVNINNINSATSTINVDTYGDYVLRWTEVNGAICSDQDDVNLHFAEPADAGPEQFLCGTQTVSLAGNNPSIGIGTWTFTGPGIVSDWGAGKDANDFDAQPTVNQYGDYTFTWTIVNGPIPGAGCSTTSDVDIHFAEAANAGPEQYVCSSLTVTLAANNPTIGLGTWTFSGPGIVLNWGAGKDANDFDAQPTVNQYGDYTFTWTIVNGPVPGAGCSTNSSVNIHFAEAANAGPDQYRCSVLDVGLLANNPSTGIGTWTYTGPGTVTSWGTLKDPNDNDAHPTVDQYGDYTFTWTIVNGPVPGAGCSTNSSVDIHFAEAANAGPEQYLCGTQTVSLAANNPSAGIGTWTYTGPGSVTNWGAGKDANDFDAQPTVNQYGNYIFRWTIVNGPVPGAGCSTNSTVNIHFAQAANAGPEQYLCGTQTVILAANNPSTGIGTWTYTGPGSVTNWGAGKDANDFDAQPTVNQYGDYTFTWTIVNGPVPGAGCSTTSDVDIHFAEAANAGPEQFLCGTQTATLAANNPTIGLGTWTYSGPGTVVGWGAGKDQNDFDAQPTVDQYGDYTFTWTIVNGPVPGAGCSTTSEVDIHFEEAAATGPNQYICEILTVDLDANAPTVGSGLWTVTSTDGVVTSWGAGATNPDITVTVNNPGTYTFRWTITNGSCSTFEETVVYFQPTATTGPEQHVACDLLTTTLTGNDPVVGRGRWTVLGGSAGSIVGYNGGTTVNDYNAQPIVDNYGTYTFRWTLENGNFPAISCSSTSDLVVTFYQQHSVTPQADFSVCRDSTLTPINFSGTFGGGATSASWSIVTGFGDGSLGTDATAGNTVSNTYTPLYSDLDGSVTLRLTTNTPVVNETCPQTSDNLVVTIDEAVYVTIYEAPSVFIAAGTSAAITADISGAGGSVTTGTWTELGALTGGVFTPNENTKNITFTPTAAQEAAGGVTLRLTSDDPGDACGPVYKEIIIGIGENPVADALDDDTICEPAAMQITLVGEISGSATSGTWSLPAVPGSDVRFDPPVIGPEIDPGTPADTTDDYRNVTQVYNLDPTDLALPNNFSTLTFRLTTNDPDDAGPVQADWDEADITILTRPVTSAIGGGGKTTMCAPTNGQYYEVTNVPGNTYLWTVPPGVTIANGGSANWVVLNFPTAGSYVISVQETSPAPLSCSGDPVTLDIFVYSQPVPYAGDDVTVCSGEAVILGGTLASGGASATGGSGSFSYLWNPAFGLDDAALEHPTATVSITRTFTLQVTDLLSGCAPVSDNITVNINSINPGTIAGSQTVCVGADPLAFTSSIDATGSGTISYDWEISTDQLIWTPLGVNSPVYDPGVPTETLYYKRIAFSDVAGKICSAESNVLEVVYNSASAGTIADDAVICSGNDPLLLTSLDDGTVSGSIGYQWQFSNDATNWFDIGGANFTTYDPPVQANTTQFRRKILSTLNFVTCEDISNEVEITVNNVTAGIISNDQTICLGGDPGVIGSSDDGSGSGTSSWSWESSVDNLIFAPVAGANLSTYDPPSGLTQTTYYRRIHTSDLTGILCSATSNVITVTINNVNGGSISADQTICNGDDASTFGTVVLGSGSGPITYSWESSTDSIVWTPTGGTAATYDPGILNDTTYFRRIATSTLNLVGCDASSNALTIHINYVDGGIIAGTQTVCDGDDPAAFTSTTAGTGSGIITYQWMYSFDNVSFANVIGANAETYDPGVITLTTYYKRMSNSTLNGKVCSAESNVLTVFINDTDPGTITGNQTICNGADPVAFTSLLPGSGPGSLTYRWESRTGVNPFAAIAGATAEVYDPGALAVTTDFRRVTITTYNTVPCEAISNVITVTINDVDPGQVEASQIICWGTAPAPLTDLVSATGSGFILYNWQNSTDGVNFNNIAGATQISYMPPVLTQTTWYRRVATSVLNGVNCSDNSPAVMITVNPLPVADISGDNTICPGNSSPLTITITAGTAPFDVTIDNGIGLQSIGASPGIVNVSPASTAVYTLISVEDANNCISNILSGNLSGSATIIIRDTVEINAQPVDAEICQNTSASFTVGATGDGVSYQWEYTDNLANPFANVDGSLISHSNWDQASLDIAAADPIYDGYYYRVRVFGTCPEFTYSDTVQLLIKYDPISARDPFDQLICEGSSTGFGVDAGITANPIFQWQLSTDNGTNWDDLADTAVYSGSHTDSIMIASASSRFNNYQYKVIITGDCGGFQESLPAILTVDERPEIIDQPDDTTVCENNPVQFVVDAGVTTNATYQWQVNMQDGSGFQDIVSDTALIYSGVTNATLNVLNATSRFDNYDYRVVVSGDCPVPVSSTIASLTVNEIPEITLQPRDSIVCEGESPFFNVNAGVTSNAQYQWQVSSDNGTNWDDLADTAIYNGANTSILRLLSVPSSYDGYRYQAIITGACTPALTSNDVLLTVRERPEIIEHPEDTTACESEPVSFSVNAGVTTGVAYQWQVDQGTGFNNIGTDTAGVYSGFDQASLDVLNPTSRFDGYRYRVIVTGSCTPSQTSTAASLIINEKAEIIVEPTAKIICEENNTFFNVNAGSTTAPTYVWEVEMGSGYVIIGSDTAIYAGSGTSTLLLNAVPSSYDGYIYRVTVGGVCPQTLNSVAVGLTVNDIPEILSQPVNDTVCENDPASFTVNAGVTTGVVYEWYVNKIGLWQMLTNADEISGDYTGVSASTLVVNNPGSAYNGYQYRVIVRGTCTPPLTSETVRLVIDERPEIITQPLDRTICEDDNAIFVVNAGVTTNPTYLWEYSTDGFTWADASDLAEISDDQNDSLVVNAVPSGYDGFMFRVNVGGLCSAPVLSNVVSMTVHEKPQIDIQPQDEDACEQDTVFFFVNAGVTTSPTYQWQFYNGSSWVAPSAGIYQGVNDDTLFINGINSSLNGTQFRLLLGGACAPSLISDTAVLTVYERPEILDEPFDAEICENDSTFFSLNAGITTNATYKWEYFNGATWQTATGGIFDTETTNTLLVENVPASWDGTLFRGIVFGECDPSDTTDEVSLNVRIRPNIITQPVSDTTCEGIPVTFNVDAGATYSPNYQWQVHNGVSWQNTSGANYTGSNTNSLTINNPLSSLNGYAYRVLIGGFCGPQVISDSIVLTIEENPEIILQPVDATICELADTSFTIDAGVTTDPVYTWYVDDGVSGYQLVTLDGVHTGITTNTLTLSGVPYSYDNNRYYVEVSGKCGSPEVSNPVNLFVYKSPEISLQPRDTAACELANVSFTMGAGDTDGADIQWKVNDGINGWQSIIDGGNYTGSNSEVLKVFSIDSAMTGYKYHAVVTGTCESPDSTNDATLTVFSAPAIWTNPVDVSVCENTTSDFEVLATGTLLDYYWQVDQMDGFGFRDFADTAGVYSGTNSTMLTVDSPDRRFNGYRYRVRVEGSCNPAKTSAFGRLTINTGPEIDTHPLSDTICEFGNVSFSVSALGANLSYIWQENSGGSWVDLLDTADYIGTDSPTMSIFNLPREFSGNRYRVIVSGDCPAPVVSDEAEVIIKTSPVITVQPADVTICQDNNTSFSVSTEGSDLTYQWQLSTGGVYFNISDDATYSGTNSATLVITNASTILDGYRYKVRVSGTCNPPVNSLPALLRINENPLITVNPSASEICEGGNTSFISGASGPDLVFQWEVSTNGGGLWTALAEGGNYEDVNTSTLTIVAAPVSFNTNLYRLSVSSACTAISSTGALLTVNANPTANITGDATFPWICGGNNLNLDGNALGGTGVYTSHTWSGETSPLMVTNAEQTVFNSLIHDTYDLVYTVTDTKGCVGSDAVTIENDIPNAQFSSNAVPACGDLTVNFTNSSTRAVSYEWNFRDGSPVETTINPVHGFDNFNPSGLVNYYNVKLTAISARGCVDSANQIITIYPKVDPTFEVTPDTACQPVIATLVTQPGASKYNWDFGDGQQKANGGYTEFHEYVNTTTSVQTYTIKLTTTSFYGCVASATQPITIYPIPSPNFTVSPIVQTYPDATVTITNLVNPGPWTYLYKFGDGTTSTVPSPTHTYADPGTYKIVQIVTAGECSDSIGQSVVINPRPPIASFTDPLSGCTPWQVQFQNTSLYANSYLWDFGDGSISTKKDPVYTYFEEGTYAITLTVSGPGGSASFKMDLEIWATPNLFFNNAPDSVYVNDKPVKFFNYSSDATVYKWNLGDYDEDTNAESSTNQTNEFEPSHVYEFVGWKDVLLIGTNEHCSDTLLKEHAVYVSPAGALQFPNVFKPNPNGPSGGYYDPNDPSSVNSIFFPGVIDQVLEYDLYIYNRWGELIFHSSEVNIGWDGYIKERLAKQGVYIWKVKGKYTNGKNFVEEGDVTLLH